MTYEVWHTLLNHLLAEDQAEKIAGFKACTCWKCKECKGFSFSVLQTVWWFIPTWWATAFVLDSGLSATMFKILSSRLGFRTALHRSASCLDRWIEPVSLSRLCSRWKIPWSGICRSGNWCLKHLQRSSAITICMLHVMYVCFFGTCKVTYLTCHYNWECHFPLFRCIILNGGYTSIATYR